jgi:hypothetical protein
MQVCGAIMGRASLFEAFNKVLNLTIDILWWYKPFLYGGLCLIYFSKKLSSSGFVFVL